MRAIHARFTTVLLFGLIVTAAATLSQAGTPAAISYQGRLTNAGGTAVPDGNYSVVFTVYDAASGGTIKWTETQSVITSGGLFAVLLGTITPVTDTVFNSATRYLGIKVGTDPELVPRTLLVSVPFSERVNTIDGSTGGSISGNISIDASTASSGNIFKGGAPFLHNFGTSNLFVGQNAGNLTMTGANNTASGVDALRNNTSGGNNTATGYAALRNNTTGIYNTALGLGALYSNTAGNFNTAAGQGALQNNTTGDGNTGTGEYALSSNTTGKSNTAGGNNALSNSTTADSNTAVGFSALSSNITGRNNTACGTTALFSNTTGYDNTATGINALYNNTTGNSNTASGDLSLFYNTSGTFNTASGLTALFANTTGSENSAFGFAALRDNNTGGTNAAIGWQALSLNLSGSGNTGVGSFSNVSAGNLFNATAIGANAVVNASNKIRLGDANVTVVEGQVAYTFTSDRNQKEHFLPVDGDEVLRKIRGLSLTSWNYKNNDPSKFRHYGPVAQEFFAAFGHDSVGQCGDSVSINSGDETGILMIAVQALERDKEQMKAENAEIKSENKNLRSELDDLKKMVNQVLAQSKQADAGKYSQK